MTERERLDLERHLQAIAKARAAGVTYLRDALTANA